MPITVARFREHCGGLLSLRLAAGERGIGREISDPRIQKAGLGLTGEVDSTHEGRVQVLGKTELEYVTGQPPDRLTRIAESFFSRKIACAVVSQDLPVPDRFLEAADRGCVPLFVSPLPTQELIGKLLPCLARLFAETTTVHGVLLDVLGVGVLLQGKSGVGKSECALDLVLRGHRIVSDDLIYLERRGPETLLGRGGELAQYHMEIRGLGIIDIRELFGLSATLDTKKVELVIHLEEWDSGKEYDRLGTEDRFLELLGVRLPSRLIPVSPGRNLATIVEVAVRDFLLRGQGIHSARDLSARQAENLRDRGSG